MRIQYNILPRCWTAVSTTRLTPTVEIAITTSKCTISTPARRRPSAAIGDQSDASNTAQMPTPLPLAAGIRR